MNHFLKRFILSKRIYCEMPSATAGPTCLNTATDILVKPDCPNDARHWIAVCKEHYGLLK